MFTERSMIYMSLYRIPRRLRRYRMRSYLLFAIITAFVSLTRIDRSNRVPARTLYVASKRVERRSEKDHALVDEELCLPKKKAWFIVTTAKRKRIDLRETCVVEPTCSFPRAFRWRPRAKHDRDFPRRNHLSDWTFKRRAVSRFTGPRIIVKSTTRRLDYNGTLPLYR